MIHPLRLRLRIIKPGTYNGWAIVAGRQSPSQKERNSYFGQPAVLEFENPLNGTWHPVEVVADEAAPNE